MKPGFLKDLASCGILVALALFDVAFGEAPICAALVFDKQKSSFARYFPVNYRAAAALIKTIYRIGAFFVHKRERVTHIIYYKSFTLWRHNNNYAFCLRYFNGGYYPAVKISYGVIYAHNKGALYGRVRLKPAFDGTVIKAVLRLAVAVKESYGSCDPHFDKPSQHRGSP